MSRGAKIRNVGPKSAAWLRQVGVRSLEDLRATGVVATFMKVRRAGFRPSLNLLYSMEGALLDCHWQEVPEARRSELLQAVEAAESVHTAATARAVGVVTETRPGGEAHEEPSPVEEPTGGSDPADTGGGSSG